MEVEPDKPADFSRVEDVWQKDDSAGLDLLTRCVAVSSPELDLKAIDVIVDRSTLRKLGAFFLSVKPSKQHVFGNYRIGAEVKNGSLYLASYWTPGRSNNASFESGYLRKATRCARIAELNVVSSQVVARAKLNGLHLLVRFEADAERPASHAADVVDVDGPLDLDGEVQAGIPRVVRAGTLPQLAEIMQVRTHPLKVKRERKDMKDQFMWASPGHIIYACQVKGRFKPQWVEWTARENIGFQHDGQSQACAEQVSNLLRLIKQKILEEVGEGKKVILARESDAEEGDEGKMSPFLKIYVNGE